MTKTCNNPECGKEFNATHGSQRYCSPECQRRVCNRAFWARKKEAAKLNAPKIEENLIPLKEFAKQKGTDYATVYDACRRGTLNTARRDVKKATTTVNIMFVINDERAVGWIPQQARRTGSITAPNGLEYLICAVTNEVFGVGS